MLDEFNIAILDGKDGEPDYHHPLNEEQIKEAETYAKSVKVRREDGQLAKGSPRVSARNRSTKDQTNEHIASAPTADTSNKPFAKYLMSPSGWCGPPST